MVRKVVEINLGNGVWANVVVPDNATREEQFEILTYHIKDFKARAETIRAALEEFEELAEDDENVRHTLYAEGFKAALESRAAAYETIAVKIIEHMMKEATADELLRIIGPQLFTIGMVKMSMGILEDVRKRLEGCGDAARTAPVKAQGEEEGEYKD